LRPIFSGPDQSKNCRGHQCQDAKVSFAEADLSLFKNFPNANVTLEKLVIINKAPFEGDTLISLGELNLKCQLKSF
jgi:hypothetical protein